MAADLSGHVRPPRRAATARRAALRPTRLRQDLPGDRARRVGAGERALGEGRGTALQVGGRERTRGARAVPPRPGGRPDADLPGRGGRVGAGTRAGHRRGHHGSGGRRAAHRAGRRGDAAQRGGGRRHEPAGPGRPGAAATRPVGATGLRAAPGRAGPRGDPARRSPARAAGARRRPGRPRRGADRLLGGGLRGGGPGGGARGDAGILAAATVTAAHVAVARERVRPSLDPAQVAWLAAYAAGRK